MRFGDTDALGHVNNASFAAYTELGRLDFMHLVFGDAVRSLILASLSIDYRRQVTYGEALHVDSWVERVGRSSMTLGQAVYANGNLAANVGSVVVYFDYVNAKALELTPAMREQLAPYSRESTE